MFPYWLSNVLTPLFPEQEFDDEAATADIQDAIELMPELPNIENLTLNMYPWVHTIGATVTKLIAKCVGIEHLCIHNISKPDEECLFEKCICDHPKDWDQKIYRENLRNIEIHDFMLLHSQIRASACKFTGT